MPELLRMPEVAANTTSALLSSWPLSPLAEFKARDTIATVETAKAVVDVEAESDGVFLATLVEEGADVEIGAPIALIGAPGEQVVDVAAALAALGVEQDAVEQASVAPAAVEHAGVAPPSVEQVGVAPPSVEHVAVKRVSALAAADARPNGHRDVADGRVFASPLARRLARDSGLALKDIDGTGPHDRIVRRDVEAAIARRELAAAAPATSGYRDVPHSRLRRMVAERLLDSTRNAPHFYLRGKAHVDALLALRAELNEFLPIRISVTDLIVKAVAQAHLRVPELNVVWLPDAIRVFSGVEVSVAVATDRGLVTPVVRGIETQTISALATSIHEAVDRARTGSLQQRDLEGGTITVTNLGMFGTEEFAAIINPPQAAILAVGAVLAEPLVVDGELTVGSVLRLTLSVDHRPVDGAQAARWMRELIAILEQPARLLA